jgi:hypothetical protein
MKSYEALSILRYYKLECNSTQYSGRIKGYFFVSGELVSGILIKNLTLVAKILQEVLGCFQSSFLSVSTDPPTEEWFLQMAHL